MSFNEKVFTEQIYILRDFLYHYESFRLLNQNFERLVGLGAQEFWVFTINSHYYQAINLWCMVFGANNNETHWKKTGIGCELKNLILTKLNMTEDEYLIYWTEVTNWRNQFSAHRVPDFRQPTPELKQAKAIVFIYEIWVKKYSDICISFSLKSYEEEYLKEVNQLFTQLFEDSIDMIINEQ